MREKLLNLIRPEIRRLNAYHVPDASGLTKLDAMENPYTLDQVTAHWPKVLAGAAINRYPDPSAQALRTVLARVMSIPEGCDSLLGNGSDEIIQMLAMALNAEGHCMLSFDPGFVMYRMIADFTGMGYVAVPLTENFELDVETTRAAIEQHRPVLIFIAYPNNPTANLFDRQAILDIIDMAPGFVVIDEAYHPFAEESFMAELPGRDNLLVMRTVSKMGLAGLRLGILAGAPGIIKEINKVRLPYNINVLTQHAASAALEHALVLEQQAALIRDEREKLLATLTAMPGLEVFPSRANFILFRVLSADAATVFEAIRQQGVLIKNMGAQEGPLRQCLRVTVGRPEENAAFIAALAHALE